MVWVIRAIIIVGGIIVTIMTVKRKKKYYFEIIVIGITAFTLGVISLVISSITDLRFDYSLYLTAVGVIIIITGGFSAWIKKEKKIKKEVKL